MSAAAPGASLRGFRAFRGVPVPLDMDALLPGRLAAALAGVSLQVIANWRRRGILDTAKDELGEEILDKAGRRLYRVRAVLAAEAAAAERCERLAGRTAVRNPAGLAA
jgi:hypothetical protein